MTNTPNIEAVKSKMKSTWESGDYGAFAKYMEPGAIEILASWNIAPGEKMLDVGCGAGQTAIPAAKNGVHVVGVDIASNLIEQAKNRAQAEGVDAKFEEGDAEQLNFPDASFDVVISLIGAMFAPQPEKVASELLRVCRPGGRIIMGNWTPQGLPGQMFKTIGKYIPPPPGVQPPPLWGDEETVRQRLGEGTSSLKLTRRLYPSWHYPFPPEKVVDFFGQFFGPIHRAFNTLDEKSKTAIRQDIENLFSQFNLATDGTTLLKAEFLEVEATRI
ncbi:class I SAM-dependent methyltransferase [Candidatus Nitronereus thalassa]|uniref:Class I SAM-dependent methyltransferase n=1 Tax=Candidatus Nitronereus thalassa TaxID=3020898 RepID=A0ABU3KC11_9BACT|nr:class I SAM-dependent methyltransferase [Candidatus Nitronereus thalassa]MDT7044039.1 class I SAM-dependent methyltransferase [Candidatus Nitronereus thalassa]